LVVKKLEKAIRGERRRRRSKGTAIRHGDRYRLVVYRSLKHIYGQIINDWEGKTLVSASSLEKGLQVELGKAKSKVEKSEIVGREIAKRAKKKKITEVVFDRNGFLYHGRVKALADGARSGGLKF